MSALVDAMRYHAAALDATRPQPCFGVITSVDALRHLAKVSIEPDGVLSGWIPVLGLGAGSGWGVVCPPAIGAQVVVVPLDGDHENLAVLPGAWSTASPPPAPPLSAGGAAAPVQPGELALVSDAGTYLRLNHDGSMTVVSTGSLTINAAANAVVNARDVTLQASGSIALSAPTITGANGGSAFELCTSEVWSYLLNHTHDDPQGGVTSAPIQSAPGSPLTTTFKAS